ncbi:hypothetical protein HD597_011171 [Nonomuraea thailandensis]|uniref:Uncharacterized protein n=1 Tax=Nonomuraea thailandensis TaxID=1188745 RepID=A0A9X2KBN0_9ACTN|nr:hypothetical protein [Nonomuraea thailandensis]MCP2364151.1 hypothetical protein [Nonomuraea thailandensis]
MTEGTVARRATVPRFLPAMRVTVILQALTLLVQAVTAGTLLSSPDGRMLHGLTALVVVGTAAVQLLVAILVWRPGGGSPGFIANSAFMLVLSLAAAALGDAHVPELHVPLGVLLFGGSVMLIMRAWSGRPGEGRRGSPLA